MANAHSAGDSDIGRDDEIDQSATEDRAGNTASNGRSTGGSSDVEPQSKPRPDNDGETVSE